MQVQVNFQGLDHSPWMDQFITKKVSKLERFLSSSAKVIVHLKLNNGVYSTTLAIHNMNHDYAFTGDGDNLYESFSLAIDRGIRVLSEHKQQIKDRISKRSSLLNDFNESVA